MPPPQSILMMRENIPHYINFATRGPVLACYKHLHRDLNKLPDPFIRSHLKSLAQDWFARFKFVTDPSKVLALIEFSEVHELKWATAAKMGNHKDLAKLLKLAVSTYGVKNSSISRILFSQTPNIIDRKSLYYKLNSNVIPPERSLEDHQQTFDSIKKRHIGEIEHSYWKLVKLLHTNGINTGKRQRKLLFHPEDIGVRTLTVLGQPLSKSRQANILKSLYDRFLRDAPRPIHPKMYEHIVSQSTNMELTRKLRRRFSELVSDCFTTNEEGKIIRK